jgi:hypothetical protein
VQFVISDAGGGIALPVIPPNGPGASAFFNVNGLYASFPIASIQATVPEPSLAALGGLVLLLRGVTRRRR